MFNPSWRITACRAVLNSAKPAEKPLWSRIEKHHRRQILSARELLDQHPNDVKRSSSRVQKYCTWRPPSGAMATNEGSTSSNLPLVQVVARLSARTVGTGLAEGNRHGSDLVGAISAQVGTLGKFCRSGPLVFSFVLCCQGLKRLEIVASAQPEIYSTGTGYPSPSRTERWRLRFYWSCGFFSRQDSD